MLTPARHIIAPVLMRFATALAYAPLLAITLACERRDADVRRTEQVVSNADQPIGVLVGLSSQRTLWIVSDHATGRVVADRSPLLVPRDSGFWWVGIAERCTVDTYDGGVNIDSGTFIGRHQATYATPVGRPAVVSLTGRSCDEAARQPGADGGECLSDTRHITFVSGSVLSAEERYTLSEQCSPAKYYTNGANRVTPLADSTRVPLAPLVPRETWAAAISRLADNEGCGVSEDVFVEQADSAWVARRQKGAWVASVWFDGPIICRGGRDLELGIPLPDSLTGGTNHPVPWASLQQQIPGVRDAAFSPNGDYVVSLVHDTLALARMRNGRIGATLLRVPVSVDDAFVMLRWASETEIAEWNRILPAIPSPVVRYQTKGP
jgi:hypothetical protein